MVAVAWAHADVHVKTITRHAPRTLPYRRAVIENLRVTKTGGVLVDRLAGLLAPREAVLRTLQRNHPDTVVGGIAPRRTGDADDVARFQRFARDAGVIELAGAAPFDVVGGDGPVFLFHVDMHERMRIAEHELHDLAFNRL